VLDDRRRFAPVAEDTDIDAAVAVEVFLVVLELVVVGIRFGRIGHTAADLVGAGEALFVARVVPRVVDRRVQVRQEVRETVTIRVGGQIGGTGRNRSAETQLQAVGKFAAIADRAPWVGATGEQPRVDLTVRPTLVQAIGSFQLGRFHSVRNAIVVAVTRLVDIDELAENHVGIAPRGVCLAVFAHGGEKTELPLLDIVPDILVQQDVTPVLLARIGIFGGGGPPGQAAGKTCRRLVESDGKLHIPNRPVGLDQNRDLPVRRRGIGEFGQHDLDAASVRANFLRADDIDQRRRRNLLGTNEPRG
jgi:hypothetical protein